MGLTAYNLVWHQHGSGWVARAELRDTATTKQRTFRFAHVDIYPWHIKRQKGRVYVEVTARVQQAHWADSVDDAKLWVEALFALEQ